jgi:hypothetical protein
LQGGVARLCASRWRIFRAVWASFGRHCRA